MKQTRIPLFRFISALMLAALPALAQPKMPEIGVIAPLSGDFARYGDRIREGVLASGINKDRLNFQDDGCDPAKALTAYQFLATSRGIRLFLGPFCGSSQVVVASHLARDRSLAVLGSSAPSRVHQISGGRMFAAQYSIEQESIFNARELDRLDRKRIVLILHENHFSRAHESAFKSAYRGHVIETLVQTSTDAVQARLFALRVKQLNPDALYVPDAYPLLTGLLKELQILGLKELPVFSVHSAHSSDVLEASGHNPEQLICSYPDIGEEDSIRYFAELSAEILSHAAKNCANADCVLEILRADKRFDKDGILAGRIALSTVRGGRFVVFSPELEKAWRSNHGLHSSGSG